MRQLPLRRQVRIGPGLQQQGGTIVASRPGVVRAAANGKVWLDSRQRRRAASIIVLVTRLYP